MRAAYVYAGNAPVFGRRGASVHVQEVVRALCRRGVEVHLVASRLGGDPLPGLEQVRVHRLPRARRPGAAPASQPLPELNDELRDRLSDLPQLDLVYERFSLGSFAAMEHAREAGIPGILEVNGPRVEKAAARGAVHDLGGAEEAARRAVASASAVVAVSAGVARHVRETYDAGARVHVVPNGVDPERFPAALFEARARRPGPFTVGFVGTFKAHHGLDHLVEAFARLRSARPDARLLLVGDGSERPAVETRLRELALDGATALPGAVPPNQVPGLLAEMDVGVAPYPPGRAYVSPLKVFEYMAAGLPVVASGVEQVAELVEHEVTGILFEPQDAGALAAALDRLAGDPGLRRRLGAAARSAVMASNTWDAVAGRILTLAAG